MSESDRDNEIEQILRRHQPAGPPQDLRGRVLSSASFEPSLSPSRTWQIWLLRAAAAVAILLAVGLRIAPIGFLIALILATPQKGL